MHCNRLAKTDYNQLAANLLQFNGDPRPVSTGETRRALSALEFCHLAIGELVAESCAAFQFHASN